MNQFQGQAKEELSQAILVANQEQIQSRQDQNVNNQLKQLSFIPTYILLMSCSDSTITQNVDRFTKGQYKIMNNLHQHQYTSPLKLVNAIFRHQNRLLKIIFRYGKYEISLNVLFIPFQSQNHQIPHIDRAGGHSTVYRLKSFNKNRAIKCVDFQNKPFMRTFKQVLKEYAILFLGDIFEFGPKLYRDSFDIIVYDKCIQFEMECCKTLEFIDIDPCQIEFDLKDSLLKMHALNIIHFDIKPSNICFSEARQKFVFIDFGFSEIVEQNIGNEIQIGFRGSIQYCSEQMHKAAINSKKATVDPYYNDAYSLNRTLHKYPEQIKEKQKSLPQEMQYDDGRFQCPMNFSTKIKYLLWIEYFLVNTEDNLKLYYTQIESYFCQLKQHQQIQLQLSYLVSKMNYNFKAKHIIQILVRQAKETKFVNQQVSNFTTLQGYFQLKETLKDDHFFDVKVSQISKQTYSVEDPFQVVSQNCYHSQYKNAWLRYFQNEVSGEKLNQYLLKVSQFLAVQNPIFSHAQKIKISSNVLKVLNMQEQITSQHLNRTILALFKYSISEGTSEENVQICINLVFSIIFLQIIPCEELIGCIETLLFLKVDNLRIIEIVIELLTAVQWLNYKQISSYKFYQIKYSLFCSLKQLSSNFLKSEDQTITDYLHILANLVKFHLQNCEDSLIFQSLELMVAHKVNQNLSGFFKQNNNKIDRLKNQKKLLIYLQNWRISNASAKNRSQQSKRQWEVHQLYKTYFQQQYEINQKNAFFNLLNWSNMMTIYCQRSKQQTRRIQEVFINTFHEWPQFYKFRNIQSVLWKNRFKQKINISEFFSFITKEIQVKADVKSQTNCFIFINILNSYVNNTYLQKQIKMLNQEAMKYGLFERVATIVINLDVPSFYKFKNHSHQIMKTEVQGLRRLKNNIIEYLGLKSDSFLQKILQKDIEQYKKSFCQIKCVKCKFKVITLLNEYFLQIWIRQQKYQQVFQILLHQSFYYLKINNLRQLSRNIARLAYIKQVNSLCYQKYNFVETLTNLLVLKHPSIEPHFYILINYSYAVSSICLQLIDCEITYFKRFFHMILKQLKTNFFLWEHLEVMNRFKVQMFALFIVYRQDLDFMHISKLIKQVPYYWMYSSTFKKNAIQEHIDQIDTIIGQTQAPQVIIVLNSFLYKENILFGEQKKKKILKKMALLFNAAFPTAKRVCLLDYYHRFITIFQITHKRRKRFLYRKSLPFYYSNEVKFNLFSIQPVNYFIPLKLIATIRRKDQAFAKRIQNFKDKLLHNQQLFRPTPA